MSSLRARFATLDRMPVPELWADVERRAAALGSVEPLTSIAVGARFGSSRSSDRTLTLLAAALLAVLLAGAVAVGSGLVQLPSIVPAPVSSASPSASATAAAPSITPEPSQAATPAPPAAWIVFRRHQPTNDGSRDRGHLWAMRADGTNAREIYGGDFPSAAWSQDGTRLLVHSGHLLVAEVRDQIGPLLDTGIAAPDTSQWEGFDFAPDGVHVVFVNKSKCPTSVAPFGVSLAETAGPNCMILSTLDLATGKRVDLHETLVKDQTPNENRALELPAWSPDGTRIAYTVVDEPNDKRALWLVNADGSHPSKVAIDEDVSPQEVRWSPDGTRISFTSQRWLSDSVSDTAVYVVDVASGRATRITTGADPEAGQLCCVGWVDNDRLRVEGGQQVDTNRFWVVTLDESPNRLPLVLGDLTDALAAIDPPGTVTMVSAPGDPGRTFFWQP